MYTEMTSEILQHFHLGRGRCEVFEGRDDVINTAKEYLQDLSDIPLTVYGSSGCGKTSVLAKILEHCCGGVWVAPDGKPFVVLARFLGTTPQTSNLYQLLDSLCSQLSKMCGKFWEPPDKFKDMVNKLFELLAKVGRKHRTVLLLDSIDQLMPTYNAYKMTWLPESLPKNVKIIVSTIPEGYPILPAMKEKYEQRGGKFLEITQLGQALGMKVSDSLNIEMLFRHSETMAECLPNVLVFARNADETCSFPNKMFKNRGLVNIQPWMTPLEHTRNVVLTDETSGLQVIGAWLELRRRTMTEQQRGVVLAALAQCSLPLYARIAYDYIRRWRSYDTPSLEMLQVPLPTPLNPCFAFVLHPLKSARTDK